VHDKNVDVKQKCENIDAIINKYTFTYHNTTPSTSQLANTSQSSSSSAAPPPTHYNKSPVKHVVNGDTGTTGHYFALKDTSCLHNVQPVKPSQAITVTLPAGEEIKSTHIGELRYSPVHKGQIVHIFESLWGSLLGIGDLCDAGLVAIFDKTRVYIVDPEQKTVVLTGNRNAKTRLWMIELAPITAAEHDKAAHRAARAQNMPQQQVNNLSAQQLDTVGDRVEFFSRTFASAAETTLYEAVKKRWIKFPGITAKILRRHKHRLRTHASAAGHLDQVHQNHQTPRPHQPPADSESSTPFNVITYIHKEKNHMDGTGRFPIMSHKGHQYMLILYSEGGNFIKVVPMADRTKQSYLKAHRVALEYYSSRGYTPTFQRLDNETSLEFEQHLHKHKIQVDLVPPHQHRRNKAERAIRTFKNHFISLLAGVDPSFPMCAWNELLEHAEITVNLLRVCPAHPRMSAWEGLNGPYDYDAHPLAPPGTAVTIFETPEQRKSWDKHGIQGFYVGPALKHYRCYNVWTVHTGSVRTAETLAWHPHGYKWDIPSPLDMVVECSNLLTTALENLAGTDAHMATLGQPLHTITAEISNNLRALTHLYQQAPVSQAAPAPQRVAEDTPATVAPQRVADTTPEATTSSVDSAEGSTTATEQRVAHAATTSASLPSRRIQRRRARLSNARAVRKANQLVHQHCLAQAGIQEDAYGRYSFTSDKAMWSHLIPPPPRHTANTAVDLDGDGHQLNFTSALAGEDGAIWLQKHGEEIVRLFTSETIQLIMRNDVPSHKKPAYYNPQVKTKIKNGEIQYRVRGTIGGNQVHYDGDKSANTASMQLIKILCNAVVSDKGAKFMTADIKDFYLGTPLPSPEYMRINLDHIPEDVIDKYDMRRYAHNNAVIVQVNKGIYGLPQAGKLAQDRLIEHLAKHGYHQAPNTPCLFKHISNSVAFTLVVDDFGIKYTHDEDADHLLKALRELYIMTEDRGLTQKYVGITIKHDRRQRLMQLSMPGYIEKALQRFGKAKQRGAKSPLLYIPPTLGQAQQIAPEPTADEATLVDAQTKTFVQEVTGVFLFYSRAVDPTMLTAVNKISMQSAKPTHATLKAIDRLLSYAERYPNAITEIRPSNMQLCAQSDASYLSEYGARSRAGAVLYFGLTGDHAINGMVEYISMVIPTVCSSVAEAEYAALFLTGRAITNIRNILEDLGYPQTTTNIVCDNSCAVGIVNGTVKQKRSKAIDMRYHWIRDQVKQGKFTVSWAEGATNLADYFTKAHPVHHYVAMRRTYVYTPQSASMRVCARYRRIARRLVTSN
jgi:hypothetical protein